MPSEFGFDVDRADVVEPAKSMFALKSKIRRAIESEGIPYTIVCSNAFAGFTLPALAKSEEVIVYGDGNTKGILITCTTNTRINIKLASDMTINILPPSHNSHIFQRSSLMKKILARTPSKRSMTQEH